MNDAFAQSMHICLSDGRKVAYSEFGDTQGFPVFFFHGWPGARLQGAVTDRSARSLGIRIISPDRPGFGLSDYQPGRTIPNWPQDVLALADQLGFKNFGIAGLSGGAPYAFACAIQIPDRVTSVAVISGIGPSDGPHASKGVNPRIKRMIWICRLTPWLVKRSLERTARLRLQDPEQAYMQLLDSLPEPDREALARPAVKPMAITSSMDTFHNGSRGHLHEILLFARPWGFPMSEIQMPIQLWHGLEDQDILLSTAQRQKDALRNCTAHFIPKEGHYSLYINRNEEILRDLRQSIHL